MSDVVGIELSPDRVRAVALNAWRKRPAATFETPWDPASPSDLAALLRERFGSTRRIALSIGLGFLLPKHVRLPPAPPAERRRMLALEPDRFFPVQDQALVVSLGEHDLAFALDAELLERWVRALESWAPVERVEPAPLSIARALGRTTRGPLAVPAGTDEHGVIEIADGRLRSARRIPASAGAAATQALPSHEGVAAELLAAWGAARGVNEPVEGMLVSDSLAHAIRSRRVRRLAISGAACIVAFTIALWAMDRSRERTLAHTRQEIAVITPQVQPALELRDRLAAADREASAILTLASQRPDPLSVLAAVSRQLPRGAFVSNIKATGAEWQIDGTAPDAAAILPLLDADDRFQDVRFLSASSRFRENNRAYETFSIAFRVRPAS